MAMTADVEQIFADAHLMRVAALSLMNSGDIRDAAEKAWCAVKRATDALITAETGAEPTTSTATSRGLRILSRENPQIKELSTTYYRYQADLHGQCFYYGFCDPIEEIIDSIRETDQFIARAERLAKGT